MSPSKWYHDLKVELPAMYVLPNAVAWSLLPEDRTTSKIRSFSHLPSGWHFGSGSAPKQQMIETAIEWNSKLIQFGFHTTDAFPGVSGEIMVTGYLGTHYVEVLIEENFKEANFRVSLTYENNNQELRCLERATELAAFDTLIEIAGGIWSTSDYFTQNTSIVSAMNSKALPSRFMMTGLQSSNDRASMPGALQYANTFGSITRMSEESPPFSGYSMRASYRRTRA